MQSDRNDINEFAQPADPEAVAHSSGSMGSRPSQAIFLGNLAAGLLVFAFLATATVLIAAMNAPVS